MLYNIFIIGCCINYYDYLCSVKNKCNFYTKIIL
jgi:hypothetical protein